MIVVYVLVAYAWFWPRLQWCRHMKVNVVVVECICCESMSVIGYECQCSYVIMYTLAW